MSSRTLILRDAGYVVEEAYSVDKAIRLATADSIDATLICHTIPKRDQQLLIAVIRENRTLMPVLCIRADADESVGRTCIAVDSEPVGLLNALRLATEPA
jgi:DNA-binding response OmpR family regulator